MRGIAAVLRRHGVRAVVPAVRAAADAAPAQGACLPLYGHLAHSARFGGVDAIGKAGLRTTASLWAQIKPFPLAQTGEGIKECELVQWFVKEGDRIEAFDRLCEIQSDKATLEITSSMSGIIRGVHHAEGAVVQVGEVLVSIETDDEGPEDEITGAAASTAAAAAPAPAAGETGPRETGDARVLTSPAVRHMARQHNLDLSRVPGTGPQGRVTKGDVMAFLEGSTLGTGAEPAVLAAVPEGPSAGATTGPSLTPPPPPSPPAAVTATAETVTVPLRGFRKAMVKSMTAAGAVPHFHFCDEVGMDALTAARAALQGDPALGGVKLTYMPFFIKAAALALARFPLVNASLAPGGDAVLQHGARNIGVAVATPHGLAVPNIKGVQGLSIAQIAAELARLQAAATANALRPEDVRGGTFTLSNIGTVGGTYATPLVNPPEVAIMALGRMQRVPRFAPDGITVVPASVLNISLGADHRVVDGATLAGFAQAWKAYIENPASLLLELR